MDIDATRLRLPSRQYVGQVFPKNRIVLHHTVGGTAKSTADYWKETGDRVATAFIIERDGVIYQCFDPKYWAYHSGTGSSDADNARSIGIELASEGALIEKAGALYKFNARRGNEVHRSTVYDNKVPYRGYRYFDTYDEPQVQASIELVAYLLKLFPTIAQQTPKDHTGYLPNWKNFSGVVSHTHLRSDKSDVHPGYPWERLIKHCNLTVV